MLKQLRIRNPATGALLRGSSRLSWSGCSDSGLGLTLPTYGIQAFTRRKAWHLPQA